MSVATSAVPVLDDRGASLAREVRVCRASRRCLAIIGHVDDLIPTVDGRVLRLPMALSVAADRDGAMLLLASERDGVIVVAPPGSVLPPTRVTAGRAPLGDLVTRCLDELQRIGRPAVLVLSGAQNALESDNDLADALRDLAVSPRIPADVQVIALFRSPTMPESLAGATAWSTHHINLPTRGERRSALGYWNGLGVFDAAGLDLDGLAAVTGGLELDDLRRLVEEHARVCPLLPSRISDLRSQALTRQLGDLMRVEHHPRIDFDDIAGGDAAFAAAKLAWSDGRFEPIGLYGPPGVGKTMIAQAVARLFRVPLIYVDGRLKGSFVGHTARNLARFREMVAACSPAVVFWDEIDLLLGRSTDFNGDSGTSNEVRQAVLTLFQDAPEMGIQVIAASNNPYSAIQHRVRNRLRSIPLIHPTGSDVLEIVHHEAAKLAISLDDSALALFGAASEGAVWNGRDIARVLAAGRDALRRSSAYDPSASTSIVSAGHLALQFRSLATGGGSASELNALEAIYVTDNPYDLPWIARGLAGKPAIPLPHYLVGLVDAEGLPDRSAIAARLSAAGVNDAI